MTEVSSPFALALGSFDEFSYGDDPMQGIQYCKPYILNSRGGFKPGIIDLVDIAENNESFYNLIISSKLITPDLILDFARDSNISDQNIRGFIQKRVLAGVDNRFVIDWVHLFQGYHVTDSHTTDTWIPFQQVNCGDVPGCEAAYELAEKVASSDAFKITVAGLGGGSTYSRSVTNAIKGAIERGGVQFEARADITVRKFERASGEFFYVADITQVHDDVRTVSVSGSKNIDPVKDAAKLFKRRRLDAHEKEHKETIKAEEGASHRFDASFDLSKLPMLASLVKSASEFSVTSETLRTQTVEHKLLPGFEYLFYWDQLGSHVHYVHGQKL